MDRLLKEPTASSLRLDKNECICPSFIKELVAVAEIKDKDYFSYSSTLEVENRLVDFFNREDLHFYTDNGSEQVLKSLVYTLNCNKWIVPTPTFEMFPFYCSVFNKVVQHIPFICNNNRFSIDLNAVNSQECGLYIVSPHNPTGYTLTEETIIELCDRYKHVVIDQAYLSPLESINIKYLPKNLILVRTFSKMGGLTGMRFGFCVTPDISIINQLNKMRPMYLNSITIKLVQTILTYPYLLNKISADFNLVKKLLNFKIIAEAGNFILVENITKYKSYKLKEYKFEDKVFYRMTLFDMETYNML